MLNITNLRETLYFATDRCKIYLSSLSRTDGFFLFCYNKRKEHIGYVVKGKGDGLMRKIVVDMQNFLFADSIATAFRNSDYEIDVIRTESPKDTVELCQVYKPFVLIMEVTGYTPWNLCERLKLRDEVKKMCPHCKIALIVDSNTERQAAIDIRDAKKNGFIDQFFYGSMTAEYLMDQIYAM